MPTSSGLELTGPQFRPLNEALRATLRLSEFDRMLNDRLDIDRESITVTDNYVTIVNDVIGAANSVRDRVCTDSWRRHVTSDPRIPSSWSMLACLVLVRGVA